MKKFIYVIFSASIILTGCSKAELIETNIVKRPVIEGEISFVAHADNSGDAKTTLDGTNVNWIKADQVMIFGTDGASGTGDAKVSGYAASASGASVALDWNMNISGTEGAFTKDQTPQYAFYPYNATNIPSISGSVVTFVLPETQTYAADSFGQDANVAVGKVTTSEDMGSIAFKNVCGYLRLKLSVASGDAATVGKIILTTKGTEKLWGTFTADVNSDAPTATYKSGATDGGTSITLSCPDGVALSDDSANPTTFYFVVPAGALEDGFTAEVYSKQEHLIKTLNSTSAKTIARNSVKSIANQTLNWLPVEYEEKAYIQNSGQQVIDTGLPAGLGFRFANKFTIVSDIIGGGDDFICGVYMSAFSPYYFTSLDLYAGCIRYLFNSSSTYNVSVEKSNTYVVDASFIPGNGYLCVNDKYQARSTSSSITAYLANICIFGAQRQSDFSYQSAHSTMRWYYAMLYNNLNDIVRDFVPAYNPNGESGHQYGMYDVLNGVFYTNVYTGEGACDFSTGTI